MLSFLTPHLHLNSVLDLSAERLQSLGRTGLLLDLDCTLKDYHATEIGAEVQAWVRTLRHAGLRLCLLSNGRPRRVQSFADLLGIPFVAKAYKPLPYGCRAALRALRLTAEQTALVGDQIFADVLAGRLAGLLTILVRPTSPLEPLWARLKRPAERLVLRTLARRGAASIERVSI